MTIAHSYSTPPRDPYTDDGGPWPVLARIPDLSAAARQAPQRPTRPIAPARSAAHRIDAPQTRRSTALAPAGTAENRSDIGKHTAHLSQPPAHHLNQRAARFKATHDRAPGESPILPDWDPFSNPGKRLPDSFAPILSFLVMVVLFAAAGTSVLMLRSGRQHPVSEVPPPTRIEQTAAAPVVPTAVGPLGNSASRLVPTPPDESTTVAIPAPSSPLLAPSTDTNATGFDVPGMDAAPPAAAPAAEKDYPTSDYPEPIFPPTIEVNLPQAAMTGTPLPIARFSGQILEAPTRQAKNDDQSSIH